MAAAAATELEKACRRGEPRGDGDGGEGGGGGRTEQEEGGVEEKGERVRNKGKKISEVWVPPVVVGIERRYREWMGAEKLNIENRISMTRTEYCI